MSVDRPSSFRCRPSFLGHVDPPLLGHSLQTDPGLQLAALPTRFSPTNPWLLCKEAKQGQPSGQTCHAAFGDVFSVIGVREPQPAASEAFVKFADAHRSIEKFGIRLLKTIKPVGRAQLCVSTRAGGGGSVACRKCPVLESQRLDAGSGVVTSTADCGQVALLPRPQR